jgi:hypothetical protein
MRQATNLATLKLLNLLPPQTRQEPAAEILAAPAMNISGLLQFFSATQFLLDRSATHALCRAIESHLAGSTAAYDPALRQVLAEAALRISPESCEELASRWTGPQWEPHRKALDEFFANLQIRHTLQREFQP